MKFLMDHSVEIFIIVLVLLVVMWAAPIAFGNGSVAYPTSEGAAKAFSDQGYTEVQVSGPQYVNLYYLCGEGYSVFFEVSGKNSNNTRVTAYECGRTLGGYSLRFK